MRYKSAALTLMNDSEMQLADYHATIYYCPEDADNKMLNTIKCHYRKHNCAFCTHSVVLLEYLVHSCLLNTHQMHLLTDQYCNDKNASVVVVFLPSSIEYSCHVCMK